MLATDAKFLLESVKPDKLSTWEKSFLKSVRSLVEKNITLSKKQADALQGIYCRSQGGGNFQDKQII